MKLTPFGETARVLRLRHESSLKSMAEFMNVSSSHLSGIEYGEKRLGPKHVEGALQFFSTKGATAAELELLKRSAEKSKDVVHTANLSPDAKGLVAAFARRLQEGDGPPPDVLAWLESKKKESEP